MNILHHLEQRTLSNNVRLLHVQTNLPIAMISLWLPCGSRHDPQSKDGLAHLMEHLLFKQTSKLPTVTKMYADNVAAGISYNAATAAETMQFHYETVAEDAVPALERFIDVLQTMIVTPDRVESEKKIIEDERNRKAQEPTRLLYDLTRAALFPGTTLEHSGLGTEDSLRAITHDDVIAFATKYVFDAPKTFVMCSPGSADAFVPALLRLTDCDLVSIERVAAASPAIPVRQLTVQGPGKNTRMSLAYGIYGALNEEEAAALELLANGYLFSGEASRLYTRLRNERNLTYSLHAGIQKYSDRSTLWMQSSVPSESKDETLAICDEEIERVRRGDIDVSLLATAKKAIRYRLLRQSMDPENVASWYGTSMTLGLPLQTVDERCAAYDRLTPADLTNAARKHLVPGRRTVVLYGGMRQ